MNESGGCPVRRSSSRRVPSQPTRRISDSSLLAFLGMLMALPAASLIGAALTTLLLSVKFSDWGAAEWASLAAAITATITGVTAVYAIKQVRLAREDREARDRPFVIARLEADARTPWVINFVVENLGATAAYDVRLLVTPPLQRSLPGGMREFDDPAQPLAGLMPTLALKQRVSFVLDGTHDRARAKPPLPDRYVIKVLCKDRTAREVQPERFVVDFALFRKSSYVASMTVHDVAEELRGIRHDLGRTIQGFESKAIRVVTQDHKSWQEEEQAALDRVADYLEEAERRYPDGVPSGDENEFTLPQDREGQHGGTSDSP